MVKNILLLDSEGKRVAVKYYSDDWSTNAAKLSFEKYVFSKTSKTNARTEGKSRHIIHLHLLFHGLYIVIGFRLCICLHIVCFKSVNRCVISLVSMLLCAAEITLLDSNIIVYKFAQDLHFFVTGGENENELILSSVLQGFFDAVALLLRYLLDFCFLYLLINVSLQLKFDASLFHNRNNVEKMEALENLDLIFLCLDEMVDQGYASLILYPYLLSIFRACPVYIS